MNRSILHVARTISCMALVALSACQQEAPAKAAPAGAHAARIQTETAGAEAAGEGAPGYDRRVDVVQLVAINPI